MFARCLRQGYCHPGTVSGDFKKADLQSWREGFYERLTAHAERAATTIALASAQGATPEIRLGAVKVEDLSAVNAEALAAVKVEETTAATSSADHSGAQEGTAPIEAGYPRIVAFAGKRQASHPRRSTPNQM